MDTYNKTSYINLRSYMTFLSNIFFGDTLGTIHFIFYSYFFYKEPSLFYIQYILIVPGCGK